MSNTAPGWSATPPPVTPEDLSGRVFTKIREEYEDVTPDDLDALRTLGSQKIHSLDWAKGNPIPGPMGTVTAATAGYIVHAMFYGAQGDQTDSDHVAGDIRIYCVPGSTYDGAGELWPFACYTINRSLPTANIRMEGMPLQTFVEEVAREWIQFAILAGALEANESRECSTEGCEHETTDDAAAFCAGCGASLEEEEEEGLEKKVEEKKAEGSGGEPSVTPTPPAMIQPDSTATGPTA